MIENISRDDHQRIAEIARLEKEVFNNGESAWTPAMIDASLAAGSILWIKHGSSEKANDGSQMDSKTETQTSFAGGYLLASFHDCAEILKIGVHQDFRRCKIAEKLYTEFKKMAKEKSMDILLEVSERNTPALAFYKKMGLEFAGKRKRYYRDGSDAILLTG